ncbi:hypothetical protein RKE29_24080 [Streptomyces sp. B1866]|uniref:hypothetical protein n=1 Tax=Streptomyces sp. B1866 TaxID=3075431 RepID=UPI00288D64B1|nr:hypothetical protein [Streptomyces sp. B1866]MDT3399681.1 hypothetical protein [Streptomyces sp. B1866]
MYTESLTWLVAGGVVTLAFFVLVGYLARTLRSARRLPLVIAAIGTLISGLPAILHVLLKGPGIGL